MSSKGIVFPLSDPVKQVRSTTGPVKEILGAALEAASTATSKEALSRLQKEKNWRFGYKPHFVALAKEMASSDPTTCLKMSEAGLAKVRTTLRMKMEGGGEEPLATVEIKDTAKFSTGKVQGDGALGALEATVPFNKKSYRGQDLIALVQ